MRVVLTLLVEWLMLSPRGHRGNFLKPHRYSCATIRKKAFCFPIVNLKLEICASSSAPVQSLGRSSHASGLKSGRLE
jgi:hypothetical protein